MKRSRVTAALSGGAPETKEADPQFGTAAAVPETMCAPELCMAPPARPQLLGTRNYVVATLRCTLAYLDTSGLGALSMTSRAHRDAITQYMSVMTDLFVYRRIDADRQFIHQSIVGAALASHYSRRLRTIAVSPAETRFDETMQERSNVSSDSVLVHGVAHVDLTRLQGLPVPIIARCKLTLQHATLPGWFYSARILDVMVDCAELRSFRLPVDVGGQVSASANCAALVRGNSNRLETLALTGVDINILSAAGGLPLTDLDMTHQGDGAPRLDLLGAFTALRRLKLCLTDHGVYATDTTDYWRDCYEGLAAALPKLGRLEYFCTDGISHDINLRGIEWRFAPSLTHIELEDTWGMPRMIGASVRKFSASQSTAVRLARLAEDLPSLEDCCVNTLVRRRRVRHALRGALERGLFRNLRIAQFNGVDDADGRHGTVILGSETLRALVRGCPLLDELDARVHQTFTVDDLEFVLVCVPSIRRLHLAFPVRADPTVTFKSCVSRQYVQGTVMPPQIILSNLEDLCVPVASDDLLERLVCQRLQKLIVMDGAIALSRWPPFTALTRLGIQLCSVDGSAFNPTIPVAYGARLERAAIGWMGRHLVSDVSLWAALATLTHIKCLTVVTCDAGDRVLSALVAPECPASGLRQLIIERPTMAQTRLVLERRLDAAALAARHPKLKHIFGESGTFHRGDIAKRLADCGITMHNEGDYEVGGDCDEPCYVHLH